MPCFSNGPTPGTREYDEWLPKVSAELDAFIHVVDYYYGKAGLPVPEPGRVGEGGTESVGVGADARVLHQILLHLDCDEVGMLDLHELRLLLHNDPASKGHRYAAILNHCFSAMRLGFRDRPTNGAQWRTCQSPGFMLDSFGVRVSDRKLRLFAVACCWRLPHMMTDERCRAAVEVAERYTDGGTGVSELTSARAATESMTNRRDTDSPAKWVLADDADEAARMASLFASVDSDAGREEEGAAQAVLLRCVLGNPFRPVPFSTSWRTGTTLALARQMYESRDFGAMPILADALADAGCEVEDILNHCRDANQVHVRGCWVCDLVLGRE